MLHGPLAKKIFMFALPLAASSILQQMFNAADLAVVGRFTNPQAMAAVGSNASVIGLLVNLFVGLSVGANVLIATLVGRGERSQIPDAVHTIITLALIAGITILILGIFLARPILTLMGAPQEVIDLATLYLRIYFCGMPVIMIYNYGSAILRSRGDSKRPFFSLTLAGVLNVLMNLLFVVVFKLHVIGVALATVLSNCVSAGLILYFLIKETDEFHLDLRRLKIRKDHLLRVVRIGLPAGLQTTVFSLSNVVIQSAINSFGTACIAGMTASQNFDFISYCMANSFAQAAVTFTSQNYGARNAKRCRQVWAWSMCMGIGIDMILIAIMMLLRSQLIRIFTTDEEVIKYAMVRFQIVILLHFICGSYEISGGALRGLNRSMVPALISVLGTCAFRLLYVGVWFPQHRSLETLLLVYPFSWVVTSIAMQTAYFIVRRRAFRETA